jgi:NACHT domain
MILSYQVSANHLHTGRDQLLSTLKWVEMQEGTRPTCLDGTRLDVIKFIMDWIADESNDRERVLWLNGLAGSGKSTLSTTIASMMRDLHLLGAFFFFNRDVPEKNAQTLIRTLAYQLAVFDVSIGAEISRIVESIPRIAEMPLAFQFTNLLSAQALEAVEWSGGPVVVVIDSLDECGSETDREVLMQALSKGFSDLPSFMRVIVVSRPETDIEDMLSTHEAVHPYHLDIDSVATRDDISEFLRDRFSDIRKTMKHSQLGADWPGDDTIGSLTTSAGGLFVWASTACLYIKSYDPNERLNELITHQSEVDSSGPFVQLDRLYKTGLQSAGLWDNRSFRTDCCNIFGAILCARIPICHSMIDSLLALPQSRSSLQSISRLGCVLHISETEGIRTLHPSFHDYLSRRCSGEPWSIDLELHNERLARHCIQFLDNTLRENICGLTLPHPVQNESPSEAVSYACKFWVEHICLITHAADDIGDLIYGFLCRHLLHWMEVLALLKHHGNTIQSLQNLLDWLHVCHPTQLLEARN